MSFRFLDFDDLFDDSNITFSMVPMRMQDSRECKRVCPAGKEGKVCPLGSSWTRNMAHLARMDVVDKDTECTVKVELPGVKKEDIQVNYDAATHVLTVEAHRHEEKTIKDKEPEAAEGPEDDKKSTASAKTARPQYFYQERFFGQIKRQVTLPDNIDGDSCTASLADGILQLVFGKKAAQESRKRISIQ